MTTTRTASHARLVFVEGVGTCLSSAQPTACPICHCAHGTIGCRGLSRRQVEARKAELAVQAAG